MINKFVRECEVCQRELQVLKNRTCHPIIANSILEKVEIDLIGPIPDVNFENKYILTMVDLFSKVGEASY